MRTSSLFSLSALASLVGVLSAFTTQAAPLSCENFQSIVAQDLKDFSSKFLKAASVPVLQTVRADDARYSELLDHRFHRVDLSSKLRPELATVTGIGVVTALDAVDLTYTTLGNGILIGDCYVLTNRHVARALAPQKTGMMDHEVGFSFGKTNQCGGFAVLKAPGQVVAHGLDSSDNTDWAIVKLRRKVVSNHVRPVKWQEHGLMKGRLGTRIGFIPSRDLQEFTTPDAQIIVGEGILGFGEVAVISDRASYPGLSGAGIYSWTKIKGAFHEDGSPQRELVLVALNKGPGIVVPLHSLMSQLTEQDPDLAAKVRGNVCD